MRCDPNGRSICRAFHDGVGGRGIAVDRRRRRRVGDADRKYLRCDCRAAGGLHGDGVDVPDGALEVDLGLVGDGDYTGRGVDREASERAVADQRIGRCRPVRIDGLRGDADRGAVGSAFDDGVGGAVSVNRRRYRHVRHRDGEGLRTRQRPVAGLRDDGVGVRRGAAFIVDLGRVGDGDDAGGIDGEAAARGVADKAIGERATVDVGRVRGHADRGSVGSTFGYGVGGGIGVGRRRRRHVADRDREILRGGEDAVAGLHGDSVGVTGRGLEVDLGGIGDGDDAGGRIDLEAATGAVASQRIGDRQADDVVRRGRDVDRRIRSRAFEHRVVSRIGVDRRRQQQTGDRRIRRAGRAAEIERLEPVLIRKGLCRRVKNDVAVGVEKKLRPRDATDGICGNSRHAHSCAGAEPNCSLPPSTTAICEFVHIC